MTLDELFDHGKEAAEHLFERQGHIAPMWIVETADGQMLPIIVPMGDRDYKEAAISSIKKLMKDKKAVRYVSIVEAWCYEGSAGDSVEDVLAAGPISEHPDRKEIVNVMAEDKHHQIIGSFYIVRPKDGKPYLSGFSKFPAGGKVEGTFTRLLAEAESVH